jgi:hypothetical protein
MTPDETPDLDKSPESKTQTMIGKAMGGLREISENPVLRAGYERRLQIVRDVQQREADAKERAIGKDMEKESLQGEIGIYQLALKRPQMSEQDFEKMSVEELRHFAEELRRQIRPEA